MYCWLMFASLMVCLGMPFCAHAQEAGDNSKFIRDVTYPDGAKVKPGQELVKKWEIQNTGSVTWQDRYLVAVESTAGEPDRKAIKRTKVPVTKPNEKCVLEATLTAPVQYGRYKVTFKMVDKDGKQLFPNKQGVYIDATVE